ncbi:MAG TPA: hypothetical protein PLW65_13745 [Pseudomonadota bacterium]|nr:hypothetical protein [Pseudomonadota bacterium]
MRTLFEHSPVAAPGARGEGRSVLIRRSVAAALIGGVALSGAVALAEEPIAVSDELAPATVTTQSSTTTTTVTATPPAAVAPSAPVLPAPPVYVAPAPVAPAAPAAPVFAPVAPAPPAGSTQAPFYFNGPVWIMPAQPGIQPVIPQQLPPPPVYVQPPVQPLYRRPLYAPPLRRYPLRRPSVPAQRGPVVGLGARFTALGISNQEIFGQKLNLIGGGIQVRFRNQGHWGFELGMDALRASISDGAFVRSSYPFTFSPMLYLRKNRRDTHFNIYAVAGFGLMSDNIVLYQDSTQERKQQFWEVLGQAGGGLEIRFTHLALFADVRAIGMLLDDSTQAGQYYQYVDGGPIPSSSFGYKANLGAMLWF